MAKHDPFTRPTIDLHAPGGLDELFALHKDLFGGWQMFGPPAPVGAPADPAAPPASPAPPAAPPAPPAPADPPAPPADPPANLGFPANTPIEQMTATQQAAYWQHNAQRWQGRAEKSYSSLQQLGITKPEEVAGVKAKLDGYTALERESMSATEKAVAEAADKARAEAEALYRPKLVRAALAAAAAGKIDAERLNQNLELLDLSKFLTDSGDVDTAKVSTYVEGLAPVKGNQRMTGPSVFGLGQQPQIPAEPGAQGRAMAAKRYPKASAAKP